MTPISAPDFQINRKKPLAEQKCFLVCNAHLDPVWLWSWEEGLTEAISTFRVAADFCDTYPDFIFNHNEALLYEWVERNDPKLFRRIQRLVKSGRWNISGGAYLQPDLIAPSGESVIRQYLVGKDYFLKKFKVEPKCAYNFDTFGHPQGLIQILKGCGMDSYVFCRPNRHLKELPIGSFRWRHRSGVEIIARRSDEHYITQGNLRNKFLKGEWEKYYQQEGDFMFLWGIGNHGGGPSHQEYAGLKSLKKDKPNVTFVESTPESFFKNALLARKEGSLPVVGGDFKPCMEGCYLSMQAVKVRHRRVENLLYAVEKYAAMAWWTQRRSYPAADLMVAWKDLLFSGFHDLVTGSGIEKVEYDGLNLLGHAEEVLRRKRAELLIALLKDEPLTERNGTPIFVFNPHAWEVSQEVEIDYGIDRQFAPDGVRRKLKDGADEIEAQFEKPEENLWNAGWGEWRSRAVFRITVPPLGYRRVDSEYVALAASEIKRWKSPELPKGKILTIATDDLQVKINLETGLLEGVFCGGFEVLQKGSANLQIFPDLNHSWMTPLEWSEPEAVFQLSTPERAAEVIGSAHTHKKFPEGKPSISILEDGPIRCVVETVFVKGASYVVQRYIIHRQSPVIHIEQVIFWAEHDRLLRLELNHHPSLGHVEAEKCYSIDDETENSRAGREMDFQHFIRFSDGEKNSYAVVSHGTHAYRRKESCLRLGILRSPSYATHEENIGPEFDRYLNRYIARQDQGIRQNKFSLLFGRAAATVEATVKMAMECNVPLDPFVYFPTSKTNKVQKSSFVKCDSPNVLITVVKKSEEGRGLILRIWETGGKDTKCRITVQRKHFSVSIKRWQLKTLRMSRSGILEVCDMIERPLRPAKKERSLEK